MRRWNPKPGLGLWIGLLLLLLALAGAGLFGMRLARFLTVPPETWRIDTVSYAELIGLLGCLLATGIVAYRIAGVLTMRYSMDRNGVYISWIGNRAVIPIGQIERIESGIQGARIPWLFLRNIGYYGGRGRTADGQTLHLFSTARPARSLVIHTATDAYAVAPAQRDTFLQELEQRRKLGVVKPLTPTVEPGRIFFYAFWNDTIIRLALLVALGLNLGLLAILATRYADLAPLIAMRFDAAGMPVELRPRHQVLFMPLAALGLSLLNTGLGLALYRRSQAGARLLQLGSVGIQVLFGVAILAIIAS